MSSNPAGSPAENINTGSNNFMKAILTAVSFGLALHYTEIQKSWLSCGSDSLCKAEKLILYLTAVLGVSSPSVLLSQTIKHYTNKAAVYASGGPLFDKDSYWGPALISMGVYTTIDYFLSFWWEWVSYATNCLKEGTCENDDILVWIDNMKARYCNKMFTDVNMEMVCEDGKCMEGDVEDINGEIVDHSDWCVVFFNELPLLASAGFIWIIYAISMGEATAIRNNRQPAQPQISTAGNDMNNANGNTKASATKDSKSGGSKSQSTKKEEKAVHKAPKTVPLSPTQKTVPQTFRQQTIQITCPKCTKSKPTCIPNPLLIFCENCRRHLGPKPLRASVTSKPTGSSQNMASYGDNNNSFAVNWESLTFPVGDTFPRVSDTTFLSFKEDRSRKRTISLEGAASVSSENLECIMTADSGESDEEIDDDELYRDCMTLAKNDIAELLSSLQQPCSVICEQFNAEDIQETRMRNAYEEEFVSESRNQGLQQNLEDIRISSKQLE